MKKNEPEIRFKGFDEAWEEHPLSYYFVVSTDKNQSNQYDKYDIFSVSREYGVINQIAYQGKSFAGSSLLNYGVIKKGDVVYTKSPLKMQPYGVIKANEGETGIVSALYGVYHPKENVNSSFVQIYFDSDCRLNDYLRPLVNKGAKNTLLIGNEDSLRGDVVFPKKTEQEKLKVLFKTLDTLIRKLELKLEKLRNIKQALLNQMFVNSDRGGYEPLIRFKGYNEQWRMSYMGQYFIERVERSAYGELISVTINDGVMKSSSLGRIDRSSSNKSNYKVVKIGDIAYNSMRMWQGACGYSEYDGICSPAYTVVTPTEESDIVFFSYLFKREESLYQFRINSQGLTSDTWNLKYPAFSKIEIAVADNIGEQKKIGGYFLLLDKMINNSDERLRKVRNMKQSLLQKMFA